MKKILPCGISKIERAIKRIWQRDIQPRNNAGMIQSHVRSLQASSAVLTRIALTFVEIQLAVFSDVSCMAFTEVIFYVISAGATVNAGVSRAIVYVHFAVLTRVARVRAVTSVTVQTVYALCAVQARRGLKIQGEIK